MRDAARRKPRFAVAICIVACLFAGCTTPSFQQRACVSSDLAGRMGQSLGPDSESNETTIPPHVSLDDGLTEDEAVAVALWNNARYREQLADLGISDARLYDAGLLTDPLLTMFFPIGVKQFELTVLFFLDAVWLRPIRLRAADLDLSTVSETMVQNGLNVIRDVRNAHAALVIARRQAELANEAATLQREIADLAEKRLKAGDITPLESTTARVEALTAEANAARLQREIELARVRLQTFLGLTLQNVKLEASSTPIAEPPKRTADELVKEAFALRPDLRAAEIAVAAACERAQVARAQFLQFAFVVDANSKGIKGFEIGPGLQMAVPLFNGNRGQVAIAEEQVKQANRRHATVRDQITLDVRTAYLQMQQARENLQTVREKILPKLKIAVQLARKNYRQGGAPYFLVLQTARQYLDVRAQELTLELAFRQAIAELERSVGRRLRAADETVRPPLKPDGTSAPNGVIPVGHSSPATARKATSATPAPQRKPILRSALFEIDLPVDRSVLPGWLRRESEVAGQDGPGEGRKASLRKRPLPHHAHSGSRPAAGDHDEED